jgi:hypothetical protein
MPPLPYHYRRGPKTARKPRANPEGALQVSVKQYLTVALPADVEWTSSLAGAYLGPSQRAAMNAQGLRPGWPDLQFIINRRTFYIELKAPVTVNSRTPERYGTLDDPDLSDDQRRILGALHPQCWAICRSVEQVAAALTRFGVKLRPVTIV